MKAGRPTTSRAPSGAWRPRPAALGLQEHARDGEAEAKSSSTSLYYRRAQASDWSYRQISVMA
jgi:hypothetical protein